VRKLRRLDLVATFVAVALTTILATTEPSQYATALTETLARAPLLFFAFVMLTEPLTHRPTRWPRIAFAASSAFCSLPTSMSALSISRRNWRSSPAISLPTREPKGRFVRRWNASSNRPVDSYDFIFRSQRKLAFQAGQYLEWTLGPRPCRQSRHRAISRSHRRPRRIRTRLASNSIRNRALSSWRWADEAGSTDPRLPTGRDFILPANLETKIAFLAGGIGITHSARCCSILSTARKAPIVVLYGAETQQDIAYRDVPARRDGNWASGRCSPWPGRRARPVSRLYSTRVWCLTIPDYLERTFYISGPQGHGQGAAPEAAGMGVRRSKIKVDYFPGFG